MLVGQGCARLLQNWIRRPPSYFSTTRRRFTDSKFEWMENVLSSFEIRNQYTRRIHLDEQDWAEFAETGSIQPTEDVLNKLKRTQPRDSHDDISEEALRTILAMTEEDLSNLVECSNSESRDENLEDVGDSLMDDIPSSFIENLSSDLVHSSTNNSSVKNLESPMHSMKISETEQNEFPTDSNHDFIHSSVSSNVSDTESIVDRAQLGSEFVDSALKSTKPGFEKRILRQEKEMSRIVEQVLATRVCEWNKYGASVHHVALSPNSRDLTIYYQVPNSVLHTAQWRKLLKRISRNIRSVISKHQPRYTPRVHFQCGSSKTNEMDELSNLFAEISRERNSTC